jgi:hypothetical protein
MILFYLCILYTSANLMQQRYFLQLTVFATSTYSMRIVIEIFATVFFYIFSIIKYNSFLFSIDIVSSIQVFAFLNKYIVCNGIFDHKSWPYLIPRTYARTYPIHMSLRFFSVYTTVIRIPSNIDICLGTQHFNINKILLHIIGLWSYRRSKFIFRL